MSSDRVVITGASGWVGRALIAHFSQQGDPDWHERLALFGSSEYALNVSPDLSLKVRSLDSLSPFDVDGADVFHLAFITKDKVERVGEAAFSEKTRFIDDTLLSAMSAARPRSLFVASSGAAAASASGSASHPYGDAKLRQERSMLDWSNAADVPVLCGRIYNIAGPYLSRPETYAIGSFAKQALESKSIHIQASVPTFRAYLHVMDLCRLATAASHQGLSFSQPVDLSGALVTELQDVAEAVAKTIGVDVSNISRADVNYDATNSYIGDATQLLNLALRVNVRLKSFDEQVRSTVEYFIQQQASAEAA